MGGAPARTDRDRDDGRGPDSGTGPSLRPWSAEEPPALPAAPALWPFLDRDGTLAATLALLGGPAPGAVVVAGPQGCGRTRLAQEAVGALRARGRRAEWAAATPGSAATPLGALAHLVPAAAAGGDPVAAFHALSAALDSGHAPPPVIGIDDAHLLDDLSARLVQELVLERRSDVVMTVLSGAPTPGPVTAIWRDGYATRLELPALTRAHTEQLLRVGLAGEPASRVTEDFWQRSRGSAALLHEMVQAALQTGHLRLQSGIWRQQGQFPLTDRLRDVAQATMGELADDELAALELLAVGGALALPDLVALTSSEVVAGLERRGLVSVERVHRQRVVRVAARLNAEVLCAEVPEVVAGEFRQRIAATPSVRRWAREDPIVVAGLLLQLDGPPAEPAVLARAAAQANARSDSGLAEQLARAAWDQAPSAAAGAALAEALRWQGRVEEAEQTAAAAADAPGSTAECTGLTVTRRLNLLHGLGRLDDAVAVAAEAVGAVDEPSRVLRALERTLRLATGEPHKPDDRAGDATGPRAGVPADPAAELWESVAQTAECALQGLAEDALDGARRGWRAVAGIGETPEVATAAAALAVGELRALELSGQVEQLLRRAAALHVSTLQRARSAVDAIAALGRGTAAQAAGRLQEARRWLTEAALGLAEFDPVGVLPLCRAREAQVLALLGEVDAAEAAVVSARTLGPIRVFDPEVLLAEAWCAADQPAGGQAALRAATAAEGMGQRAVEAVALHTAVRLGLAEQAGPRLAELATDLGGGYFALLAAHAEAAARGLGEQLDDVSAEFLLRGARLLAADAAAQAAEAHRLAGRRRRAAASAARAVALVRDTGGLPTPALRRLEPYTLTPREHEIATAAAAGVSNQEIARSLVLSVRTIETHLAHAYDKLGISGRAALRGSLEAHAD